MNQALALRVLSQTMLWSDERAREEFGWLRLMARLKYDGYRDFQAGMRFIESLATWLQQFKQSERETAYAFVRQTLVYIGPAEMQRLVEQFYPRAVRDRLVKTVARERSIPTYRVFADAAARADVDRLRRQTLFMGLSDGARIDTIRHANAGLLSNEQLVQGTQVDTDKWEDLRDNLRRDLGSDEAGFRLVYLIDDFAGTGTTFLRSNPEKGWKGKLIRFRDSLNAATKELGPVLASDWELCVHHYVASANAAQNIERRLGEARAALAVDGWAKAMHASFGTVLPADLPIDAVPGRYEHFIELTQTYYDSTIETKHTSVGGVPHVGLGYGGCALPLVLEHNTPNNSVALLWAETNGGDRDGVNVPAMRPLFRRRQRHT
ncbi:MAG TPA: hypothetical protein VE999_23275 [Gemmataceae bacterium]|nr:hypothetical protein [Gemmataceae bacterium]